MKPRAADTTQTLQRVKVGITGLVVVLLLIMLASLLFRQASNERPVAVAGVPHDAMANTQLANTASGDEPLAELGVAPSTQGDDTAANSAQPLIVPPPVRRTIHQ